MLSWPSAQVEARARATATDPDHALVAAARDGDLAAFEILFHRHRPPTLRLAGRFLENADDAEEAVTDAFVRAFRALKSFRGDAQFATWLYRITVNVCIRRQRQERRDAVETSFEDTDELPAGPAVEALIEARARRRLVRRTVNALSPKLRAVVALHYFDDMPCEQIAEVLGVSIGTVWSRLHAAKAKLSAVLARELYE